MPTQTELEQAVENICENITIAEKQQHEYVTVYISVLQTILTALSDAQESAHYATGVADLAMKHRDEAEKQLTNATAVVEKLTAQLAEARKDMELLDWMDKNRCAHIYNHFKYHESMAASQQTWRKAIDSAMTQQKDE